MGLQAGNSLYWKAGIDVTNLRGNISQAQGMIAGFAKNISAMDVFAGIAVSFSTAMIKIAKESYNFSKSFEHAMTEVATISGDVHENFAQFSNDIVKLSERFPISANALAKGLYELISAGQDATSAMELLNVAATASVAGFTDLATTVDGMTTIINAWKYSTKDATWITDVMFKTVERGKIRFEELAASISVVAPIASASGIGFEQIAAAIQTLTKQGVGSAEAITQIRQAILSTNEVLGDGWAKSMSLQDAFQKVAEAAGGSQVKLRELVGRVEAVNGILGLTGQNARVAQEDLAETGKVAGTTANAFKIAMDSLENELNRLNNVIQSKLKPIGDLIVEDIKSIVGPLEQGIDLLGDFVQAYLLFERLKRESFKNYASRFKREEEPFVGPPEPFVGPPEQERKAPQISPQASLAPSKVEVDAVTKARQEAYAEWLEQHRTFREEIEAVDKHYDELRKVAESEAMIDRLNAARDEEINTIQIKEFTFDLERRQEEMGLVAYYKYLTDQLTATQLNADQKKIIAEQLKDAEEQIYQDAGEAKREQNRRFLEMITADLRQQSTKDLNRLRDDLKKQWELYKDNKEKREALERQLSEVNAMLFDRQLQQLENVGGSIQTLGNILGNFDDHIARTSQSIGQMVNDVSSLMKAISAEDIGGGIFAGLSILGDFFTMFGELFEKTNVALNQIEAELTSINNTLRLQEGLISQITGEFQLQQMIAQAEYLGEELDKIFAERPFAYILEPDVTALVDKYNMIWDEINQRLTGTTRDAIADALTQGFMEGKPSAEIFADTFEDMMAQAMIQSFQRAMTTKVIDEFYTQFAAAAEGGLTDEEIAALRTQFLAGMQTAEAAWEELKALAEETGIDLLGGAEEERQKGLAGAISGITEETAGLLAGQFHALIMDTEVTKLGVSQMASNTQAILARMERLVMYNAQMVDYTSHIPYMRRSLELMERGTMSSSQNRLSLLR